MGRGAVLSAGAVLTRPTVVTRPQLTRSTAAAGKRTHEWADRRINGRTDIWARCRTNTQPDSHAGGYADGHADGLAHSQAATQTDGHADGRIRRQTGTQTDGYARRRARMQTQMDGHADTRARRQTGTQTDGHADIINNFQSTPTLSPAFTTSKIKGMFPLISEAFVFARRERCSMRLFVVTGKVDYGMVSCLKGRGVESRPEQGVCVSP
ncbi:Protein of unknown function [Gryllus bimaculatus]|nr:Protein of unknown function [Gryllus bimaculatus]